MQHVQLYLSTEHACGYLPLHTARNAYVDPAFTMTAERYRGLIERGFRRSGSHAYRPHCSHCRMCIPARIPVARFTANRAQKRCVARNRDLPLIITRGLTDEHYELYRRYISARHPGGGMDTDNREAFHAFLECDWGETQFWEFRNGGNLLALAVVDVMPAALSAVYTFFDPEQTARGLGTYAVLQQISRAAQLDIPYVYLGYWVPTSRKMDYKKHFQPLELLGANGWMAMAPTGTVG